MALRESNAKWALAALLLSALACGMPNFSSMEQTASAGQQTLAAGVTNAYGQITPQDFQATQLAETVMAIYAQQTVAAQGGQPGVATITLPPGALTETPIPATVTPTNAGTIAGKVCFPAGGIPPLTIYAAPLIGGGVFSFENPADASIYSVSVPAGNYTVFAYPSIAFDPSGTLAGGYTQAVPCGLAATCADHTLIEVAVYAGQTTPGVDICDWYAPPGSFPPRP